MKRYTMPYEAAMDFKVQLHRLGIEATIRPILGLADACYLRVEVRDVSGADVGLHYLFNEHDAGEYIEQQTRSSHRRTA